MSGVFEFEVVAGPYSFTEGPVWDGERILFTDIPTSRIMAFDPATGETKVHLEGTEKSNGLALDAQGRLHACQDEGRRVVRFEAGEVEIRLPYSDLLRRPGGTICGPALMALADVVLYGVVMSMVGRIELAITTDMNVHFLSRPPAEDVIANGRILKLGRRLAVGEVVMHSVDDPRPICHVTGSHAIPPDVG